MRTIVGLMLLALATATLASELMYLADPAMGMRLADPAYVFIALPTWYVRAARWALIALTGWAAARLLGHGIVGRLVRGRGLTPEPARR